MFLHRLVAVSDSPEFHETVNMDKAGWPRCLLWHGWLPALSGVVGDDPWAIDAGHVASKRLEVVHGSYVGAGRELGGEFSLVDGDVPLAFFRCRLCWLWCLSGLMVVLFSMVFRELALLGVVSTLVVLVLLGLVDNGGTWICFLLYLMVLVRLAGCIVLFLALCRLCSAEIWGVLVLYSDAHWC